MWLHQSAHPVTVSDAVQRFRASRPAAPLGASPTPTATPAAGQAALPARSAPTSATPVPLPGTTVPPAQGGGGIPPGGQTAPATPASNPSECPTPGVYVYATSGYDETNALSGAHNTYPAQTTVTIQASGCGWTWRWQPLNERHDQWLMCHGLTGVRGVHFTTFHQFFHQTQQQDFDCSPSRVLIPGDAQPGQKWPIQCTGPSGTAAGAASTIDLETLSVGGSVLRVVHVHFLR